MIAVITEREPACRILAHLGLPTDPLPVARARDPTYDADASGDDVQPALGLAAGPPTTLSASDTTR
jgi:hypothetical protein